MPVFTNGKIINIGKNEFKAKDGELVSYRIYTISTPDGQLLSINSKQDFSSHLDIPSTITLSLRADTQSPKLFKLSLIDFSPLPVDGDIEKTVR